MEGRDADANECEGYTEEYCVIVETTRWVILFLSEQCSV